MAELRLVDLDIVLGRDTVLSRASATIPDGAFAAVVGPSGSGKSTLLRSIAGLEQVAAGGVYFDGVDVTGMEPGRRDIGMVFQKPVLFAHRSVRRNVAFPLEIRRQTMESIRDRVHAESRAMHIEHLLQRNPRHLSRGEQQLVQIARTMVRTPGVLLLDEPFAPLDEHLRRRLRAEIGMLQAGYGVTTLMATNDPDDVAALASHVIVLGRSGTADPGGDGAHTVVQAGDRTVVADDPTSLGVAEAMGTLWTLKAQVESDGIGFWLTTPIDRGGLRYRVWTPTFGEYVGRDVTLGFGAGDLVVHEDGELDAIVDRVVPGAHEPLACRIGSRTVYSSSETQAPRSFERQSPVRLRIRRVFAFDSGSGRRIA